MKGIRYLSTGLIFGIVIGWALGFLRLPYLEKNYSFLLGFVAALAVVSLALLLWRVRNREWLSRLTSGKTANGYTKDARIQTFLWIVLLGVLVLGGGMVGGTIYRRNEAYKVQIHNRDRQLQEMAALIETLKKNDLKPLMTSLLEEMEAELKHNPGRQLRDTTIARIAALSLAFKPYKYLEADSLSEKAYSPERGQLLQALVLMQMDTASFARIKRTVGFAGADLQGASLKGLDLSGIQLQGANLKDADLSGTNLNTADLGEANLWGANLNQAKLSSANLKRADLSWAQLNEAILPMANLDGAKLSNAQLRKADLNKVSIQWAQSEGALYNEANLSGVLLTGTNFSKANWSQAKLSEANIRKINLSEAILLDVAFNKTVVDEKWLEKLKVWQPTGLKELQENYTLVNDSTDKFNLPLFRFSKN